MDMMTEATRLRQEGKCPICKKKINVNEYRNKLSWEEAKISGLCQQCQDKIFGKD